MTSKNALITQWASRTTSQRDLKFQIDRLIEQAKDEMEKQTKLIDPKEDKKPVHELKRVEKIEEVIGHAAAKMARDVGASCVISVERDKDIKSRDSQHIFVKVTIYRRLTALDFEKAVYKTKMRKVISGSIVPIKDLLAEAISKKYINKGDRVVCVEDESLGMGYKALLFIFDVDKIFFNISTMNLGTKISPDVLESVIQLALEIGKEGREGRKIGTSFIVGNAESLSKFSKQLIINPFLGYPEEQRSIRDHSIRETIKEFSQLDGVFLLNEEGTVLSAGTHLNVDASVVEMPGYGTRHRCSAAITKHCEDVLSVVVSESGGITSVFKNGNLMLRLP